MTVPQEIARPPESATIGQIAAHWAGAAVTVLFAYAGLVWLVLTAMPQGAEGALQDAVMIELEPMTAFEDAPPPAPEPELAEAPPVEPVPPSPEPEPAAEPEPVVPPEPAPPEPTPPEPVVEEPVLPPEPVAEEPPPPPPVEEPEPLPEPTTQEVVPDLMETNTVAEAVINPPIPQLKPPPPRPVEKRVEKKKPAPPKKKVVERPKPKVEKPRRAAEAKAPVQRSATPRSDRPAASRSAQAPRVSTASWSGKVSSHIRRFKRSVTSTSRAGGVARVTMTVDGGGRVSGVRIASSSGNPDLDAEAVALVRRASPFPPPPAGVAGQALTLPVKM